MRATVCLSVGTLDNDVRDVGSGDACGIVYHVLGDGGRGWVNMVLGGVNERMMWARGGDVR